MRYSRSWSLFLTLTLLAVAVSAFAERGDDSERKSKNGKTEGQIGDVNVVLEYGRPNVKGREVWGGLVPYGKVWRTGADEATTVTFSDDVKVEGQELPAGTYGLFTIPGEDEWTVIFNKTADQWGAFDYDAKQDALRVMVKPEKEEHVESLDFVIADASIVLRWELLAVPFRIEPAP